MLCLGYPSVLSSVAEVPISAGNVPKISSGTQEVEAGRANGEFLVVAFDGIVERREVGGD